MEKQILRNELVEVPGEPDAYYKVDVTLDSDTEGKAWVPELGRVRVKKDVSTRPAVHTSFAWKVQLDR